MDRALSDRSFKVLYALRESMSDGPRFEVVANEAAQAALTAAAPVVGQPVSAEQAAAICSDTSATGIVSLDTLRVGHDWSWDEREEERTEDQRILKADGNEEEVQVVKTVTVHQAFLRITADSTWSVMACDGTVLDEHTVRLRESYSGEGDTKADARINTGNLNTLRSRLMGDVGVAYRGRISPWSAQVERRLFQAEVLTFGPAAGRQSRGTGHRPTVGGRRRPRKITATRPVHGSTWPSTTSKKGT